MRKPLIGLLLLFTVATNANEYDGARFRAMLDEAYNDNVLQTYSYTTDLSWFSKNVPNANKSHSDLQTFMEDREEDIFLYTAKAGLKYHFDINTTLIIGAAVPILVLDEQGNVPRFRNLIDYGSTEFGITFTHTFK